jgi:hypothetical protein
MNRHELRNKSPSISLMNMVHENKATLTHEKAFLCLVHVMEKQALNLWEFPKLITTDRKFVDIDVLMVY